VRPYVVEVAGLAIAFASDDPRWPAVLAPRYGAFRSARTPDVTIGLETRGGELAPGDLARLAGETVAVERRGATLAIETPTISARLDLDHGRGSLAAPLHRHGVDLVLRALVAARIDAGLLVHGALVAEAGRAWICAGPSGAGKSTLAELAGEHAFCDELALVRRSAAGWHAESLPFWHGRPFSGSLAGVRLLIHGERHRLRPLGAAEAARRLAPEIVWPASGDPARPECAALECFAQLLEEVEIAELAFRPRADVWPHLVGAVA